MLVHNRYLQRGGEDEAFAAESALLRRRGHAVVEYIEDNLSTQQLRKTTIAVRALWSRPAENSLRRLLREHRPEVAHFHNTFPLVSPAGYYTCRSTGTPVVQTLHNYRLLCPGANLACEGQVCERCLGRWLTWPGIRHRCYHHSVTQSAVVTAMLGLHRLLGTWRRQVDLFIALSEFARDKFIQGGLPGQRIVVKPNVVDPDPGAGPASGGYVLFAGRLSPEKGVAILLQAWRKLPHIPLHIAGDGPLLEQVRAYAASAAGNVKVLGRCGRRELSESMKQARFLLFPSQCYENFPMVVAEAFACGLPVIATRLGAAAEMVADGRLGLLVRHGDAEDLAEKSARLWAHPEAGRRMGREARAEFQLKYGAQSNLARLLEIYESARARKGGQRTA